MSRAEIDRRLIAAYLEEDDPSLEELVPGLSAEELRRRAVEIGLSRALVRECRLSGVRVAMRACVRCDDRFLSVGPQNRLCRLCSRRDATSL